MYCLHPLRFLVEIFLVCTKFTSGLTSLLIELLQTSAGFLVEILLRLLLRKLLLSSFDCFGLLAVIGTIHMQLFSVSAALVANLFLLCVDCMVGS